MTFPIQLPAIAAANAVIAMYDKAGAAAPPDTFHRPAIGEGAAEINIGAVVGGAAPCGAAAAVALLGALRAGLLGFSDDAAVPGHVPACVGLARRLFARDVLLSSALLAALAALGCAGDPAHTATGFGAGWLLAAAALFLGRPAGPSDPPPRELASRRAVAAVVVLAMSAAVSFRLTAGP